MTIDLSYIITTRNRLPFLQVTLGKLMAALQPGEEIVVVDGDSTDGSKAYLQQLFNSGKIHQFISEPDKNQAHGWNKAMLMAKGTVIKKIIDDDVFCYDAIRKCKDQMLAHPDIDVIISNDLSSVMADHLQIQKLSRYPQFERWKNGQVPSFTFGDVHLLIRRSAIAYIGLYDTDFVMMDYEYALRISHLQANIVYYTGYNALTVAHPQTVTSQKQVNLIMAQGKRADHYYQYAGDSAEISLWSKVKIAVGKKIYGKKNKAEQPTPLIDLLAVYEHYYHQINLLNNPQAFTFISK